MRNHTVAVGLIISLIATPMLAIGQEKKPQDEIKLTTELVQIDVIVTDKNNKAVAGLTREDFELIDNNKPQHITNLSYEVIKAGHLEETATTVQPLPRAISPSELKRVIAFVVDTLHIKFENIIRTRKMLSDFVENQMQPGDLVLILPTGGGSGVLQQFTSDRRLLHRAIARLRPFYFSNDSTPYRRANNMNSAVGGLAPTVGAPDPTQIDPFEAADARASLRALDETIKSISKLPGRKVSVLVSEGFRLYSTDASSDLRMTTGLAARGNVVFYTIDPRGLDPGVLTAADELDDSVPFNTALANALDTKQADLRESRQSLEAIADDTGGRFYGNNNDIKRGLDSILEENSAYYMLGFYPEAAKWDGKFHKIKVALRNRPDLTVSFRKGYLAKSTEPVKPDVDPKLAAAIEAISSPLIRRDIDLRLTPLYIDDVKRDPIVTILLHIDASKLTFAQSEGKYKNRIERVGFVIDEKGNTVSKFSDDLDMNLRQQTYDLAMRRGFVDTRVLNLKPGVYQIRVSVRESGTGAIGTANDYIEVPDLKADRLTTSSLFLTGRALEEGKVVEAKGTGGTPSQRRFQSEGAFSYSMVIYNAKGDANGLPQLEMRTRVLKGDRPVYTGELRPVQMGKASTPPARIVTAGVIKLAGLEPGDYWVEVLVRDKLRSKDNVLRAEMDFSVEK
ncbi:MAG TPA: VWA domain-containing protein [Blastocatellia bacterium]|nr:VWA domain-containing protein [Blastocatellia bacterium]